MTERGLPIVEGAPACPFVAFEDDRDERASSPDHRHRCYAEPEPAPRALAHQEAYCLSSAFPVCPTFQDWARREAARARAGSGPDPRAAAAGSVVDGASVAAAARDLQGDPVPRNPRRNWTAPPPWVAGDDAEPDNADAEDEAAVGGLASARGLSGSLADRMTSEAPPVPRARADPDEDAWDDDDVDDRERQSARRRERDALPAPVGDVAEARSGGRRDQVDDRGPAGASGRRPQDRSRSAAPDWERPRRLEAYPTIRSRRLPELTVPPLLVGVVALVLAAAILFALPGLLGFGGPSAVATPTPSTGASHGQTVAPTVAPAATPQLYVVQPGDTMSRIAGKFGVPLGDLIAANRDTVPNPDKLQIGDQVIIPVPVPSQLPAASGPAAT